MDGFTFLGAKIPLEIKKFFSLLPKLKQEDLRAVLLLVVSYIKGTEITESDFDAISGKSKVDKATLSTTFTGLLLLFRAAIRTRAKSEAIEKDLNDLRLPEYLVKDIAKILRTEYAISFRTTVN